MLSSMFFSSCHGSYKYTNNLPNNYSFEFPSRINPYLHETKICSMLIGEINDMRSLVYQAIMVSSKTNNILSLF
jgi:hypothetical protein